MSVYAKAIRDDKQAKEFAAVWKTCKKHDIEVPDEIQEFFGYVDPESVGDAMAAVEIPDAAITRFEDDCYMYMDIDLSKLPPDTKRLRVYG